MNQPAPERHNGRSGPETDPAEESDPEGQPAESVSTPLLAVTGDEAIIEGDFKIADSLKIECEIGGSLEVGGRIVIGRNGNVHANVHTTDALIFGSYEGDMVASGEVEIAASGRVTGNIRTDSLVINKGGFFNGNVEAIAETPDARSEPDAESEPDAGSEPDGGPEPAPLTAIANGKGQSSENGSGSHPPGADASVTDEGGADDDGGDAAFLGQPAEAVAANA